MAIYYNILKKVISLNTIIESALFRNAIVFLNEAIHHFNLGINQYDNKILAIVDLQMSLELSIKFSIANNFSINDIFDEKSIKGLSEEEIISSYQSNKLKVKEFEQLKNFLKSDRYFCTEFSSDFSYMEKFQNYRNKLVHQNYNFSEEEENTIENDIIYIIVYILYRLLSNDISSSDYNDYLYEYIPENEYMKLLLNEKFAKEIKLKFETEYGKLYTCPLCGFKSLTPMKKCYRCLELFEDGFSYGYVKCAYCGEDYVIFDAVNMDCNKGFARGLCLNCEEDTIVYKCHKCGEYNNLEAFGRKMCTPEKCLMFDE